MIYTVYRIENEINNKSLIGKSHPWQDKINKNIDKISKTALTHKGMKRNEESKLRMTKARMAFYENGGVHFTKNTKWDHDPKSMKRRMFKVESDVPEGWIKGMRSNYKSRIEKRITKNTKYEILTDEGFKDFSGISMNGRADVIKISTSTTKIKGTPDHKIMTPAGWVQIKDLNIHDIIITSTGNEEVTSIKDIKKKDYVYDILSVKDINRFYANDLLVSNCLFLDEFAFVPKNIAEEFMRSVYPTISSGKKTKIFIVSTPYGMNHFHKMWIDAIERRNLYKFLEVKWDRVPGRDEKWKKETIKNIGPEAFSQEFDIMFIGSAGTLIDPVKLRNMLHINPLVSDDFLRIYEEPDPERLYIEIIDTSEGLGLDASVCTMIDITTMPYEIVAIYQSTIIDPHLLPEIAVNLAKKYNESYILCELNSVGVLVTSIIWNDLEYENMLWTTMNGRKGQVLGAGFSGKSNMGLKTSPQTKRIGCSVLKTLIESDQLIVNDWLAKSELSTFVREGSTYKGQSGMPDDIVMTLVIFAWISNQPYFRELTNIESMSLRAKLLSDSLNAVNEMISPFGIISNGLDPNGDIIDDVVSRFEHGSQELTEFLK